MSKYTAREVRCIARAKRQRDARQERRYQGTEAEKRQRKGQFDLSQKK